MNALKLESARVAAGAAPIGALGIAVILFAAMWSGDAKPEPTEHDWLAERAESRAQMVARGGIGHSRLAATQAKTRPVSQEQRLPAGIAPGLYLVADTQGETRRLRVTRSMASRNPTEQEHYMLLNGRDTMHFIRIRTGNRVADSDRKRQSR